MDELIFMQFSGKVDYDTRNNLEHCWGDAVNHIDTGFNFIFYIFWIRFCLQHYRITDEWVFMKFAGYGHKEKLARLFHARLACFTFLKLAAVEVCALGVLLVLRRKVLFNHYKPHCEKCYF